MRNKGTFLVFVLTVLALYACGDEYYSTPQKTLARYVDNKDMSSAVRIEATLNCFTKRDRDWFSHHYQAICEARFGKFSNACGGPTSSESSVWGDVFEAAGPNTTEVESADVNEKAGTAVLVINGRSYNFKKEKFNWKFDGLFGMEEQMISQYPQIENQ